MQDSQLLEPLQNIAIAAGEEILEIYNASGGFEVELKQDNSPLTEADRRAHLLIVARLQELTPDIPVLSEESEAIDYQTRSRWQQYWLVDPLDGTKEFVKRNGEFTVNIALIRQGRVVLGVVYVPVTGVCYRGLVGFGAWKQKSGEAAVAISVDRFAPTYDRIRVVASRRHGGEALAKLIECLQTRFAEVELLSMGSSLKICLIAEGLADLYPRLAPTCEWDTAAAHGVLAAAGGEIVDIDFKPLRYNQKDELLNPYFFALADNTYAWQELLPKGL
ncbi:MAG: 3'(2'),5'-bisphosphate nucleotidase [SAR86 cluster bacterium]|uniref:3'(2'),5'-bisphosphate nucleotidase CysQ n=1 Tax=SAR86 cluster bacterium TaxID=2030880 RepID=A0A2A4MT02_9GAMM|nr:MAG: 3'(2'),5'-bisphosphate nucleotidase [SAR86 cluster bacterium]